MVNKPLLMMMCKPSSPKIDDAQLFIRKLPPTRSVSATTFWEVPIRSVQSQTLAPSDHRCPCPCSTRLSSLNGAMLYGASGDPGMTQASGVGHVWQHMASILAWTLRPSGCAGWTTPHDRKRLPDRAPLRGSWWIPLDFHVLRTNWRWFSDELDGPWVSMTVQRLQPRSCAHHPQPTSQWSTPWAVRCALQLGPRNL